MRRPLLVLSALGLVLTLPGCVGGTGSLSEDPVTLSFVTVGCNRVDRGDWHLPRPDPDPNPSSANVNQLRQTFADVAALVPAPDYFFFTGDLVLGDTKDDGSTLRGQLDAWGQLYASDPLSGTLQMVPLPGNHEMLAFDTALGDRVCLPAANPIWSTWMAAQGFDVLAGHGPAPSATSPGPDNLVQDESRLTYSRTLGPTHFVFLNTDTCTTGGAIGMVAYHWLAADLAAAQADRGVRDILILGHKPILPAAGVPPKAHVVDDRAIAPPLQQPMIDLLVGTPKVKAYLCSHAHEYEATRLGNANGPWQIIVGNGGSSLEPTWLPAGGAGYGFLQVNLHATGRITATPYARPVPSPYQGPATAALPMPGLTLVP